MQDLNDLRYFAVVVEQGGFAAGARKLGVPRSRLSRRIGLLEENLGVRLIQRTTRQFAVTDLGRDFYRHCTAMMLEAEAAIDAVERMRAEPQGLVRLSCPASVIYFQVGPMIARLMARYPKLEVQMESTNRSVDVVREGLDLAIRVRFPPLDDSDLVIRKLADSPQLLAASPTLLAQFAPIETPADLEALPSLAWGAEESDFHWRLRGPGGEQVAIQRRPRFATEDMEALRLAAIESNGVCQFPAFVARDDIRAGRLTHVLPDWAPRTGIIHAAFPSRRGLLPSVRATLDFLADEFAALTREDAA